jgi:hypothetical protein
MAEAVTKSVGSQPSKLLKAGPAGAEVSFMHQGNADLWVGGSDLAIVSSVVQNGINLPIGGPYQFTLTASEELWGVDPAGYSESFTFLVTNGVVV